MRKTSPELALSRLLQALETELIEAGDDEIAAALGDLGMRAGMKGSAASFDLRYLALRRLSWLHHWPGPQSEEEERSSPVERRIDSPSATPDRKA